MNDSEKSDKGGYWFDRGLLLAILLMQGVLFWQSRVSMRQDSATRQALATPDVSAKPALKSTPPPPVERQVGMETGGPDDDLHLRHKAMAEGMAEIVDAVQNVAQLYSAVQFNRGWEMLPASPSLDMRGTEGEYLITFNLPEVHPEDLGVLLEGRVLTVRALCGAPGSAGGLRRYERRVLLPGPVGDAESAQAHLTNGVLRVQVPRGSDDGRRSVVMRLF